MRWLMSLFTLLTVACAAAPGQGCYGGSPGGYGYPGGYSYGYSRGYEFGSRGLPPMSYGYQPRGLYEEYELPPPAVYESRTPYFAEPPRVVINFDQRGRRFSPRSTYSYRGSQRTLFDARVRVGSRGYCPGGY